MFIVLFYTFGLLEALFLLFSTVFMHFHGSKKHTQELITGKCPDCIEEKRLTQKHGEYAELGLQQSFACLMSETVNEIWKSGRSEHTHNYSRLNLKATIVETLHMTEFLVKILHPFFPPIKCLAERLFIIVKLD